MDLDSLAAGSEQRPLRIDCGEHRVVRLRERTDAVFLQFLRNDGERDLRGFERFEGGACLVEAFLDGIRAHDSMIEECVERCWR